MKTPKMVRLYIHERYADGTEEEIIESKVTGRRSQTITAQRYRRMVELHAAGVPEGTRGPDGLDVVYADYADGSREEITASFYADGWRAWREYREMCGELEPLEPDEVVGAASGSSSTAASLPAVPEAAPGDVTSEGEDTMAGGAPPRLRARNAQFHPIGPSSLADIFAAILDVPDNPTQQLTSGLTTRGQRGFNAANDLVKGAALLAAAKPEELQRLFDAVIESVEADIYEQGTMLEQLVKCAQCPPVVAAATEQLARLNEMHRRRLAERAAARRHAESGAAEPVVAPEPEPEQTPQPPPPRSGWTGADLRAWRTRMGWSQPRAAQELGMHEINLSKLENGRQTIRPTVRRLAECLEMLAARGVPAP